MSMHSIGQAAALYKNMANIATTATSPAESGDNGASFGSLVKAGMETLIETQQKSEQVTAAAVAGNASVTDVVQAVTEAEITLQTMVAVRDRVISAYQDIMRMPI